MVDIHYGTHPTSNLASTPATPNVQAEDHRGVSLHIQERHDVSSRRHVSASVFGVQSTLVTNRSLGTGSHTLIISIMCIGNARQSPHLKQPCFARICYTSSFVSDLNNSINLAYFDSPNYNPSRKSKPSPALTTTSRPYTYHPLSVRLSPTKARPVRSSRPNAAVSMPPEITASSTPLRRLGKIHILNKARRYDVSGRTRRTRS